MILPPPTRVKLFVIDPRLYRKRMMEDQNENVGVGDLPETGTGTGTESVLSNGANPHKVLVLTKDRENYGDDPEDDEAIAHILAKDTMTRFGRLSKPCVNRNLEEPIVVQVNGQNPPVRTKRREPPAVFKCQTCGKVS